MTHSTPITQSARGMHCTVRIARVCAPIETVVFAHLYPVWHRAIAQPKVDLHGCYACHACHDIIDRRGNEWREIEPEEILERKMAAMMETQKILLEKGLIRYGKH